MRDLKRDIALNRYEVDPHAVAEAMLRNPRRLRRAGLSLNGAARAARRLDPVR